MRRVLTMPGFGAFAIMTNVRFKREKRTGVRPEDSVRDWSIGAYAGRGVRALRRRKEKRAMRLRMNHAAPAVPFTVPLILDFPMRG